MKKLWLLILFVLVCLIFVCSASAEVIFNGENLREFVESHETGNFNVLTDESQKMHIEDIVPEDGDVRIDLGPDGQGGQDFVVLQNDVFYLRDKNQGGDVAIEWYADDPTFARVVYKIAGLSDAQKVQLREGRKVLLILPDRSIAAGKVFELKDDGRLFLTQRDHDKLTLFSFVKCFHLRQASFHIWDLSGMGGDISLLAGTTMGSYEIKQGKITITARGDGAISITDKTFIDLDFDLTIDLSEIKVKIEKATEDKIASFKLFEEASFPLIELFLEVDLSPEFYFQAKGTGEFTFGFFYEESFHLYHKLKFLQDPDHYFTRETNGPQFYAKDGKITGEIEVGLSWGPLLDVCQGLATIGITYKAGLVFDGSASIGHTQLNGLVWHACNNAECFEFTGRGKIGPLAATASFLIWEFDLFDFIDSKEFPPFITMYKSDTFNDSSTSYLCPHKAYLLPVVATDRQGHVLENAVVSYQNYEKEFEPVAAKVKYFKPTGCWPVYVPKCNPCKPPTDQGNKVTVKAEIRYNGNTYSGEKEVTEYGIREDTGLPDPQSLFIQIPIDRQLCFVKNEEQFFSTYVSVKNFPKDYYFYRDISSITIPGDIPTADEYVFTGWNDRQDGLGKTYQPGESIDVDDGEEDIILYAQWKPAKTQNMFYLYYNANGGSKAPFFEHCYLWQDVHLSPDIPVWGSHTFLGWSLKSDSAEPDFQPSEMVPIDTINPEKLLHVQIYAVWRFDPADPPCRLTFNMNGGPQYQKPPEIIARKNSIVMIRHTRQIFREGYRFLGWNTDRYANVGEYQDRSRFKLTEDTTLYAIWKYDPAPAPNRIEFRDTGSGHATNMPKTILFMYQQEIAICIPDTIPEKPGLLFTGWNTAADGSGTGYAPGVTLFPEGDMILYAQWRLLTDQYVIIYNPNGGTYSPSPQFVHMEELAVLTSEPAVWANHTFLGWSFTDDSSEAEFPYGKQNTFRNTDGKPTIVLYAVWSFDPVRMPVRLSYDINGGPADQRPSDQWVTPGSWFQIVHDVPVWNNLYTFAGWSIDPNANEGEYGPGSSIRIDENTTLYAIWQFTPVRLPIRISYDLNGGLSGQPESHTEGNNTYFSLSGQRPAWDGQHTFLGWSRSPSAEEPEYQPGELVRFSEDTTLYAVWKVQYRITEGNGSLWIASSGKGLQFVANGNILYFHYLLIDGKILPESDYKLSSGSTVVDLTQDYLKTLQTGHHTITFGYIDGKAEGAFFVKGKEVPATGDRAEPALWAGLFTLGVIGLFAAIRARNRHRRKA